MASPWIIGGAVVAAGYGLYRWLKGKASGSTADEAAFKKGFADGQADAIEDVGKARNERPLLNSYPTDKALQATYEKGYYSGYDSKYVGPSTEPTTTKTDAIPTTSTSATPAEAVERATKDAAKAAWLDGCARGVGFGWKDAANGYENKPTPATGKFSSPEANAAYVYSYSRSYNVGYTTREKMSGLPGYDEGEATEIPASIASDSVKTCNAQFESWYTSKVAGLGTAVGTFTRQDPRRARSGALASVLGNPK